MKIITEIRNMISGNSNTSIHKKGRPFDCITSRKGITRELMISKESRSLIGLISPSIGEGMFLVSVLSFESERFEQVVTFQRYDITDRRILLTGRLTIDEIKGVCPFIHNPGPTVGV